MLKDDPKLLRKAADYVEAGGILSECALDIVEAL